jgi:hypothetical protein
VLDDLRPLTCPYSDRLRIASQRHKCQGIPPRQSEICAASRDNAMRRKPIGAEWVIYAGLMLIITVAVSELIERIAVTSG